MMNQKSGITQLLIDFFSQQKQLYGDEFILSSEQFTVLQGSLLDRTGPRSQFDPNLNGNKKVPIIRDTKNLDDFYAQIKDCQKCTLGQSRTNFVFGAGNPHAELLLVGEAPGADEDRVGEPFVGKAGQLLNKILKSIDFNREDVFIANILKCRPPGNRDPLPEEVDQCEPYLHQQIRIIQPRMILVLGRIAGQTLLKTELSLTNLRGKLHYYQGIPMVVTYHPAALLRNPNWKYPTWDDVRYLKNVYSVIKQGGNPETVRFEKKA
jgi:DNA polymerase